MEAALRFLEPRARSSAEVRRRLGSYGYRADLVESAVERLMDLGVLDDEVFAREWVRSRDRTHPRGERALRSELRTKGVADQIIDAVFAGRADANSDAAAAPDAEENAARRLLERKAGFLRRGGEPRQTRQRSYGLLMRNGFSSELAWRLAAELAAPLDDEPPGARRRD